MTFPADEPFLRAALLAMLITTSLVMSTGGVAHAVTVPPGGSRSACSEYEFLWRGPNVYWQTCAWADAGSIAFTVNFGNTGSDAYYVDRVDLHYVRSGSYYLCPAPFPRTNVRIPPHAITSTPRVNRVLPRDRAAYQAVAIVRDADGIQPHPDGVTRNSPTLQVL